MLNHLTDGASFTLHCCWRRFVLSKTLLQLPIPDRSKYIEGVVGNKKLCNYDVTVSNGVNLCDPVLQATNAQGLGTRLGTLRVIEIQPLATGRARAPNRPLSIIT